MRCKENEESWVSMENIEIRTIRCRNELEDASHLWAEVFPEDRAFFLERLDLDPSYEFETTWIAKVDGRLAAAVQLFPYFISLQDTCLKVGGIGNVAALPQYRGKNLTRTILNRQINWMSRHGYDLSFLFTGINAFYEKSGWQTVPRRSHCLNQSDIPAIETDNVYSVSEFRQTDLGDIKNIYKVFNRDYVGTRIRNSSYWEGQLQWSHEKPGEFLVARREGKIVGYVRARFTKTGDIDVKECCYLHGEENAVTALIKELLARKKGFKKFRISVAEPHELLKLFKRWGAEETTMVEEMWRVLDFNRLMAKLRHVFSKRLCDAESIDDIQRTGTSILLQCGLSEVLLSFRDGIVDVEEPTEAIHYNRLLKCSESEFVSMLLKGAKSTESQAVSVLFPRQAYQFWGSDCF